MTTTTRDQTLVTALELWDSLAGDQPPTLLDVRWVLGAHSQHPAFLAGHIPGARFADLDSDLSAQPGAGGRHPLPTRQDVIAFAQRSGVTTDRTVVVYDERDSISAARAWWVLRWAGHPDVRVLDGGLAAWRMRGLPLHDGPADDAAGGFTGGPARATAVDIDDVLDVAGTGVLLDARAPERYRGDTEPIDAVAGHIPGAVNAPTLENIGPDGRFHSGDRLRERFARLGVTVDRPVAAYCGSGVFASHEILALHLAGFQAGLFAGSWSQWVYGGQRPVARGPR